MKRILLPILFLMCALMLHVPQTADASQQTRFPIETAKLNNGMEVVIIPDHRTPVVTHMVWYRVGSADDPHGQSGLAHFLEHLMFKGTEKNPGSAFQNAISAVGGRENAFTSYDYTAYFQRISKDHLKTVMRFEADRMRGLNFTDAVTDPEREVVLEERAMRTDNDPSTQLSEEMSAALFQNHPYGTPIIGWESEIKILNREKAMAFYRRFYAPQNAILVISGDVTLKDTLPHIEEFYGSIPADPAFIERRRVEEPEPRSERRVVLSDARVRQPRLSRVYLAPAYSKTDLAQSAALDVAMHIVGEGQGSRLYRALVKEKQLAASAGGWYDGAGLDYGRIGLFATPRENIHLEALEKALDETLEAFVAQGPTPEELARAKSKMTADAIYMRDNSFNLARIVGMARTTGVSLEDVQRSTEALNAVTSAQAQKALADVLVRRRSVTGYLLGTQ